MSDEARFRVNPLHQETASDRIVFHFIRVTRYAERGTEFTGLFLCYINTTLT
jgi:hypothetical protein